MNVPNLIIGKRLKPVTAAFKSVGQEPDSKFKEQLKHSVESVFI